MWKYLECDHLPLVFSKLSSSRQSIPMFHEACMELKNVYFPYCQMYAPDSRFSSWNQWNRTMVLENSYELMFPVAPSSLPRSERHSLHDKTARLVRLPWETIHSTVPGRRDVCYLGDFNVLLHSMEYEHSMYDEFEDKEFHVQMNPPEGTHPAPIVVVFHYGLESDRIPLYQVGTTGSLFRWVQFFVCIAILLGLLDVAFTHVCYHQTHILVHLFLPCLTRPKLKQDRDIQDELESERKSLL